MNLTLIAVVCRRLNYNNLRIDCTRPKHDNTIYVETKMVTKMAVLYIYIYIYIYIYFKRNTQLAIKSSLPRGPLQMYNLIQLYTFNMTNSNINSQHNSVKKGMGNVIQHKKYNLLKKKQKKTKKKHNFKR